MLTFHRTVTTARPPDEVFDYLADFTHVGDWDPRAQRVTRVQGDGRPGSRHEVDVSFARRTVPMTYTTTRLEPHGLIEWVGETSLVRHRDLIRLRPAGSPDAGTVIDYSAQFRYHRASWLLEPLLRRALRRLCDDARQGLVRTLAAA